MKLNFRDWKKVNADDSHTTMRNDENHEIKIYHKALSPKLRGQLAALPMHGSSEKKMAKGGEVNRDEQGDLQDYSDVKQYAEGTQDAGSEPTPQPQAATPQSPVTIHINNGAPSSDDNETQQTPPDQSPAGAPASVQGGPGPGAVPQNEPMPDMPAPTIQTPNMGAQGVASQQDQSRMNFIQNNMEDRNAFAQDLNNGHITPKTYGELADKSTFGRLGTMFGLMIGGIGSGVTGQPNALLNMMNNEIDRDLKAQQESKTNAQNLYNLTSQRIGAEANAGLTNVQSNEKNLAMAKMYYQQLALHKFVQQVQAMPPGPNKMAGQNILAMMYNKVNSQDMNMLDNLYMAGELYNGPTGGAPAGNQPQNPAQAQEDAFKAKNEALIKSGDPKNVAMAENNQAKHFPYIKAAANDNIVPADKELYKNLNQFNDKMQDLQSFMKQHGNVLDNLSPSLRAVAMQKARETAMLYGNSIPISQTEGARNWLEEQFLAHNPISVIAQNLLGTPAVMKEIQSSNGLRQKDLLGKYGINESPNSTSKTQEPSKKSSPKTSSDIPDGTMGTDKQGRRVIRSNGQWIVK